MRMGVVCGADAERSVYTRFTARYGSPAPCLNGTVCLRGVF